ncbi:MAG TPA: 3-deoxy-D-manno-octulosonic acid transferase [Caulobacteraceae bacterium]
MSAWPLTLRLYAAATAMAEPLAPGLLARRARRGKEDPARIGERLGRAGAPRPEGPLAWIHAVSVGESLAHLPLVERLRRERPDLNLLVTSATRTSAALLARRLPSGVIHQYAPIDGPGAVGRFLDHWRPDLGIFVESELWPNLLHQARDRGCRLALLGARISARSAAGWRRAPAGAKALLGLFEMIYAQDLETRAWIEAQGAHVDGCLDLKRLADPLPVDEAALAALKAEIGGRRVLLAASTHPGEELLIAEAAGGLRPEPLLIVVPRHPERGGEVCAGLQARGLSVASRSQGEPAGPGVQAYVADTLGELGLFYRAADVVVLGGAFALGLMGHNPLEPARLGMAVISGPHHESFAEIYGEFLERQAVLIARDPAELGDGLQALFGDPRLAQALGQRALAVAEQGRESFEPAWARLERLLPS